MQKEEFEDLILTAHVPITICLNINYLLILEVLSTILMNLTTCKIHFSKSFLQYESFINGRFLEVVMKMNDYSFRQEKHCIESGMISLKNSIWLEAEGGGFRAANPTRAQALACFELDTYLITLCTLFTCLKRKNSKDQPILNDRTSTIIN